MVMTTAIDPFIFYRPGELTLFLEPLTELPPSAVSKELETLDRSALASVDTQLANLGIALHEPAAGDPPQSMPLVLRRMYPNVDEELAETARVLYTVRLLEWLSEDEQDQRSQEQEYLDTRAAVQSVAVAIDILNTTNIKNLPGASDFLLHSWSPNWLAAPFGQCSFGSPGGLPRPLGAMAPPPTFRRDADGRDPVTLAVEAMTTGVARMGDGNDRGRGVVVAVLDTWPVRDLAQLKGASGLPFSNLTLNQAVNGTLVQRVRTGGVGPMRAVSLHSRRWPANLSIEPAYDESNHGLFVASIVRDLAPEADIAIYQVLNDGGVGDLMAVATAVQVAMQDAKAAGHKLVLNLSLGIGVPGLLAGLMLVGHESVYDNPDKVQDVIDELGPNGSGRTMPSELDQLVRLNIVEPRGGTYRFKGMFESLDFLFAFQQPYPGAPETLVIAAAGNNSKGVGFRFGPRIPAALEGVVAVSAIMPVAEGLSWDMTSYSNEDDLFTDNDGVSAFGGDVTVLAGITRSDTGVKGLYAAPSLPVALPGWAGPPTALMAANTSGWASWSGTSFATPIVAGLAACLWSATGTSATAVRGLIASAPDAQIRLRQFP